MTPRHITALLTLVLLAHVLAGQVVEANEYETTGDEA